MGRAEGWGVGAAGVLLSAALAAAQTPLTEVWDRLDHYANTTYQLDEAVDIAVWTDESNPQDIKHWVFVTGYMSNGYGGHFIATYRYDAADGSGNVLDYYPNDFATTTLYHKAAALALAPGDTPGDFRLYITGYTEDEQGNRDFVTIKYKKSLERDESWADDGDGDGVRVYDRGNESDDVPVDVLFGEGTTDRHVVVIGTTLFESGEDDITTVWYDAADGSQDGVDHYDGPGSGVDLAAEGALAYSTPPDAAGPVVIATGTSYGGSSTHDDLVAILYDGDNPGSRSATWSNIGFGTGVRRYDGPDGGNELCTGISHAPQRQDTGMAIAVLIGRTPRYPAYTGDEEYLLYALRISDGSPFWDDDGYGDGARTTGPAALCLRDTAWDAVTHESQVFVTGEHGSTGSRWRVGTHALGLSSSSDTVTSTNEWLLTDLSDPTHHGLTITTDGAGRVYVVGWCASFSEAIPARFLTLRLDDDDLSQTPDVALYTNGIDDRGAAVWWHGYPGFSGLFVTGNAGDVTYLWDWGTVRYVP